ncbi:AAA family ATPase, partial [Micromonospora azadirachtae]
TFTGDPLSAYEQELADVGPPRNPRLRGMYGKSLRGGLLLYGPPGCGKTFLARAVAGEMGARFVSLSMVDVLDRWQGDSEGNLHELFQASVFVLAATNTAWDVDPALRRKLL